MYIEVTSDVNKNGTFLGLLRRSQELINAKILYSSQKFTAAAELWYAYKVLGLEIPVENTLISVFWMIEKVTDSCALDPGQI